MITPIKATALITEDVPKSMLLYSPPKAGKTLFGAHAPKNIAHIDFENGNSTLRGFEGIDIFEIYKTNINMQYKEFEDIINSFKKDDGYKTILIDNLYFLSKACMFKINRSADKLPGFKEWNIYNAEMYRMLYKLKNDLGKNVIITAHIQYKTDANDAIIGGFPKVDGIYSTVGGIFDEFYLLSCKKEANKLVYKILLRGDNLCATGTRYLTPMMETIDWTNKDPFTLLNQHYEKKGGFK